MKIQFHKNLHQPQTHQVSSVVIYDSFGNPISVAVEIENGIVIAETLANPEQFHAILRSLGISKTVIVHDTVQRALPSIDISGK